MLSSGILRGGRYYIGRFGLVVEDAMVSYWALMLILFVLDVSNPIFIFFGFFHRTLLFDWWFYEFRFLLLPCVLTNSSFRS
jgi:hypothetical protein